MVSFSAAQRRSEDEGFKPLVYRLILTDAAQKVIAKAVCPIIMDELLTGIRAVKPTLGHCGLRRRAHGTG